MWVREPGLQAPSNLTGSKTKKAQILIDWICLKVKILQNLHILQKLQSSFEIILIFGIVPRLQEP